MKELYVQKKLVKLDTEKACVLIGNTGSGKTTNVVRMLERKIQKQKTKILIADGKNGNSFSHLVGAHNSECEIIYREHSNRLDNENSPSPQLKKVFEKLDSLIWNRTNRPEDRKIDMIFVMDEFEVWNGSQNSYMNEVGESWKGNQNSYIHDELEWLLRNSIEANIQVVIINQSYRRLPEYLKSERILAHHVYAEDRFELAPEIKELESLKSGEFIEFSRKIAPVLPGDDLEVISLLKLNHKLHQIALKLSLSYSKVAAILEKYIIK